MKQISLFGLILIVLSGCTLAEVQVNVVSERTALENQVLGSYNSLGQEMLLVASVRGVDPLGKIKPPQQQSQGYKDAIEAMQTLAFHADDVEAFKRLGWTGENNQGFLAPFPIKAFPIKGASQNLKEFAARYPEKEFAAVIQQVNTARDVVMKRVVEINEDFTTKDLPKIRRVFGNINRENALPGEKIQKEDGSWMVKK
jgi:uncharacterized protein YdbL (DUF1318 family)